MSADVLPLFRRASGRAESLDAIPRMTWEEFIASFEWQQGEHVGLIGPTGSGKTTLALALLPFRKYVVVTGTKPRDDTMTQLLKQGYTLCRDWDSSLDPTIHPRRLLWPDVSAKGMRVKDTDDIEHKMLVKQHKVFKRAMARIYRDGKWCIFIDELWWWVHMLKMERTIRVFLQQSRSLRISLVVATQRPAFVPLEVYDQSTHLFFFRDNDERNLKRISGISWLSANLIRSTVARLDRHEVLYVNTRDGMLIRTQAPSPEGR